ncbi:hypothetical protein Tco_0971418 [Tanacetum coccineum]
MFCLPIRRIHQGRYGISAHELHKKPQRLEDLYVVSMKIHTPYSLAVYERFWKIFIVVSTPRKLQYAIFRHFNTTWMAFGGNKRDWAIVEKKKDKIYGLAPDSQRSICSRDVRRRHKHKATSS